MKLKHPNNNEHPTIIPFDVQQLVDRQLNKTGKIYREKYGKKPTNKETYNITLNALRNMPLHPTNRSLAEHYLWFIASDYSDI